MIQVTTLPRARNPLTTFRACDADCCRIQQIDAETMKAVQWATAGQTVMMEREGRPFASFYTFVDSQTTQPGTSIDEGFLEPNEEGNLFEHGDALNPETNRITGYEELWKPIEVKAVSGAAATPRNVVIELHDDSKGQRGRVVCTGQYCQGVVRERDDFAVERWSWHDGAWSQRRIGSLWLPTQAAIHNRYLTVGQQVEEAGAVWKVVEADL